MTHTEVVTGLLRNRGDVLLCRNNGPQDSRWGGVTARAAGDPAEAIRREIHETMGLDGTTVALVRRGDPVIIEDGTAGQRRRVHPFLFDCEHREVTLTGTGRAEWVSPTAILDRETVPGLRESYDRVRPRVETVAGDREHGSTHISMQALAVLRDEAGLAARGAAARGRVAAVARELLAARPAMTAVANRVHRVMATADPEAIERVAHQGIERAARVDREAATAAASRLGDIVATRSRSGTVRRALALADPDRVLVAESRPGREGVEVAADLARSGDTRVTLTTDAGFAAALTDHGAGALVVGADAVLADGRVVNKVGTRGAALAAAHEGVDVVVVTASDKVSPGTDWDPGERDPAAVYAGDAPVAVTNPTFDVTPPEAVDAVVTERGVLDAEDIERVADEHRALRDSLTRE